MHILGLENICLDFIFMFSVFVWLFACLMDAAYMKMCANECKCILHCISA